MKLEDPIAAYKGIVDRHRRAYSAANADCLRIGGSAPNRRASTGPVALLGASGRALGPDRVERTVAYLGALGGLLADLGYDVFAISSLPHLDTRVSFVGWVGGGETRSERELLASLDTTGVAVGTDLDATSTWALLEPDDRPESIEFIGSALYEIRRLTAGDDPASASAGPETSTRSSTLRAGTGSHRMGRSGSAWNAKSQLRGTKAEGMWTHRAGE